MALDTLPPLRLQMPIAQLPVTGDVTVATIARLIASGTASSKADLATFTGLARTTVTSSVQKLIRAGVVTAGGLLPKPGRGRPAEALLIDDDAGDLLVFDCGVTSTRLAVVNLRREVLAEKSLILDLTQGPDTSMTTMIAEMKSLLVGLHDAPVRQVAVMGLPARLDYRDGSPVRPATMPLWDGFQVAGPLGREFGCQVIVENDANLQALGESRSLSPDQSPLLTVKVGTGIGAGLITEDGCVHRGSAGASGEMGHMTLRSAPPIPCRCGNVGCLEAVASIPALLARYRELAAPSQAVPGSGRELAALLRAEDELATAILRDSAAHLGEAIAHMVNIFNPARVVISGITASASDELLARVRSMVYEHARPLATRNLQVAFSSLGSRAGLSGAVVLGVEQLLSPEALMSALR